MIKLCANLSMLFNEHSFLERFKASADAGFRGVEYLSPYEFDKAILAEQLKENNLTQVLFNLPAGDWNAGERGIAIFPDRISEFKEGVDQAIEYAKALDCKQINVLAGIIPADIESDLLARTFLDNIQFAAVKLEQEGIRLLIEPINTFDIPNFYIKNSAQVLNIIEQSNCQNIYLQYDIYHMQRMEGELSGTILKYLPHIAHLQLADNPGRNEPGTGEINYPYLLNLIEKIDYQGWIGCEYKPLNTTEQGLTWATDYFTKD
ncbi:hydroxypyruvate isomerase [Gammaproteobacteria bacterium]|nr:hydroxypyruvate isomerase [Gammaproteobacteria bacterium]